MVLTILGKAQPQLLNLPACFPFTPMFCHRCFTAGVPQVFLTVTSTGKEVHPAAPQFAVFWCVAYPVHNYWIDDLATSLFNDFGKSP